MKFSNFKQWNINIHYSHKFCFLKPDAKQDEDKRVISLGNKSISRFQQTTNSTVGKCYQNFYSSERSSDRNVDKILFCSFHKVTDP